MAQTLLSMAGAAYAKPDLAASVLVMIDCQQEYTNHALALPDAGPASAEAARVAAKVRAGGGTVIHVRHQGKAGGAFDLDHARGAFIPACAPEGGEVVVTKGLPNAFAGTDLADQLSGLGKRTLILTGFMTHMCVSATARAALDVGFGPAVVVADACATRDLPHPTEAGKVMAARDLHEMELAALADRFAFVVDTADAL
ncbi:MAG: isochorismatase family protein [Pseudomonadota bacterium]